MKIKLAIVFSLTLMLTVLAGCAASGAHRSTGEVIDDSSIAASIKTSLLADTVTDGLNIDVEVDRNRVQLNGFVDSQAQVNRAGEIAKAASGVSSVENNLRVSDGGDRMAGEYADDKTLQARVKAALLDDPAVKSMKIDVEVNRGEVSLGGFVDSNAARNAAVATASKVEGVRKVVNNLTVR